MAVSQRLDLRQTQTLVMTPQLQQAIKLLQLSNLEVSAFVEQELERNPLLERDEDQDRDASPGAAPSGPDEAYGPDAGAAEAPDRVSDTWDLAAADTLPGDLGASLDTDFENLYDNSAVDDWALGGGAPFARAPGGGWPENDRRAPEENLSQRVTLRQHLLDQLQMDMRDPVDRMIGAHLIEMLDESGYLGSDLDGLADLLGCAPGRIEATLEAMQRFDPPGIFARSLRECLALQLAERNRLDPAMQVMLDNLPLLAKRDFAALRRLCGVDDEDLAAMISEIKALDPKPAQAFDHEVAEPVVPDVLMRADPGGGWVVELNSDTLPRVLVNARYYALVASRMRSKADKEYITQQYQSANWLVRSLHQRATTILRVATEIIRQQDSFFRQGVQHLKPLIMRDVAEAVAMHESTVSRVTSNKYMATPRGIYELRYFFTSAIGGTDGMSHSAEAVRHRIRALIEAEAATQVLSDDAIVGQLHKEGIEIARRTVAKYRETMGIPSSVQRRREKTLSA